MREGVTSKAFPLFGGVDLFRHREAGRPRPAFGPCLVLRLAGRGRPASILFLGKPFTSFTKKNFQRLERT